MRKRLFGRPFLEELLVGLAAGSMPDANHLTSIDEANRRARAALSALTGSENSSGRVRDDDDQELLQLAYWYCYHLRSDDIETIISNGPDVDVVRIAAKAIAKKTLRASSRSRAITLARKFKSKGEFERLLRAVYTDAFEEAEADYIDLKLLQEMFERRDLGFDMYAFNLADRAHKASGVRKEKSRS